MKVVATKPRVKATVEYIILRRINRQSVFEDEEGPAEIYFKRDLKEKNKTLY